MSTPNPFAAHIQERNSYPLTNSQLNIYLGSTGAPNTTGYNIPYDCIFPKEMNIDIDKFKAAVHQAVDAYPFLKIRIDIVDGEPSVIPQDNVIFDIPYKKMTAAEFEQEKEAFMRPFKLEEGPLFHFALYETDQHLHFMVEFHHTISDGTSLNLFLNAIGKAYEGQPFVKEEVTAFTLSNYERTIASSPEYKADKAYFDERLKDVDTNSNIPADLNRSTGEKIPLTAKLWCPLPAIKPEAMAGFVLQTGVSDSVPFLGAFAYTLARFSGNKEALFSTVHAGRRAQQLKTTMGMLVRTIPVYVRIDRGESVETYLQTVKKDFVATMQHSNTLSFGELAETYNIKADLLFVYQSELLNNFEFQGRQIPFRRMPTPHAKANLSLMVFKRESGFELFFEYRSDLYSEALIRRFAQSMETVLSNMMADSQAPVNKLSIISPAQEKVLQGFREVATCPVEEPIVHRIFEKQAVQHAGKTALIASDKTFTYAALNEQANILAHSLIRHGIQPQSKIIVLLPRTSRVMISILGILKTGSAWIPCDPDYPAERIKHIMTDSGAGFIITTADRVNDFEPGKAVDVEELLKGDNTANPGVAVKPEDYSYIIYTSGSTGKPKGVLLHHYGLANYVNPHKDNLHAYVMVQHADIFLCLTTVSFDVSVHEMFVPLCNGKTLIFAGDEEAHNPIALASLMLQHKVEYYGSTPSRLGLHMELDKFNTALAQCKVIMVAGEKYSSSLHEKVKAVTKAKIIDGYGPTEITILSNASELSNESLITVGRPLTNYVNFIVDGDGNELPQGVVGELYIGGAGVAHGYNNLPEMTQERFIDYKGVAIYKSGDYAKWTDKGEIIILGRTDNQVKLRGLRIELGEIETAIAKYEGIKSAVVVIKQINATEQLCAYFTATGNIDTADLKAVLAKSLTQYMVPAVYMQLEKLPTTPNGKTDIKSLPEPVISATQAKNKVQPQRAATFFETELTGIVSGILGHNNFSITDDLLYRGLTSLSVIKLSMQVYKRFGYSPDAKTLMEGCSIIAIENAIQQHLLSKPLTAKTDHTQTASGNAMPLSQNQQGVYFDCMRRPGEMIYNIPMCLKAAPDTDAGQLAAAVNKTLAAHPYMFTTLELIDHEIMQVRNRPHQADISVSTMNEEEFKAFKAEFVKPFDLQKPGPLFRFAIVQTPVNVCLLMDVHHIIFDGWSINLFIDELLRTYEGQAPELETYSYFDFVTDEIRPENLQKQLDVQSYFDQLLGNCENASEIPADQHGAEDGQLEESIYPLDEKPLDQFCRNHGLPLSGLFLAAANYTVSRFTNNKEVYLSTISNGRSNFNIQRSVGMFVNTVPLAAKIGQQTVVEFIKQAKDSLLNAVTHEYYPYTKVVTQYNYAPNIVFAYQLGILEQKTVNGKAVEVENLELKAPKFKLAINIENRNGQVCIVAKYNNALYSRYTMNNFTEAMATAINNMTAQPEAPVSSISLISPVQEKELQNFRETATCPIEEPITHHIFENQVLNSADKTALIATDRTLTYKELNEQANILAHELIRRGIKPQSKVVILLPRTSRVIISILGIMKTGSAYIPCDPDYPIERINHVLEDSGAGFIITTADRVGDFEAGKAVDVEELLKGKDKENPKVPVSPDDHSYIIYTSGSTGKPKGVLLHHRGLANYVNPHKGHVIAHTMVENADIILGMTTVSFDVSVLEIFVPLCNGKTLVFISDETTRNPAQLAQLMKEQHIQYYGSTPSRLAQLLEFPAFCEAISQCTVLVIGGEKFSNTLREKVKKISKAKIINGYGPTEITISSHAADLTNESQVTVGRTATNYCSFIVDSDGNELPQGIVGELYIGGVGVAHGYNNLPEMTQERFIHYKGVRVYKSGDYAKWNNKGEVIILGRTDNQVKIRGLRIELSEIETAVSKFNGIKDVVVVIKKLNGVEHLCAYFTGKREIEIPYLKDFLKRSLTQYMVPTIYTQLDSMPATPNGKTDIKALPEPALVLDNEYESAANEAEQAFCDIFAKVLDMPKVGATDNFFDLGGTSLLVTRIIIEAVNHNFNINYGDVFTHSTPRKLATLFAPKASSVENVTDDPANYNYEPLHALLKGNNIDAFRKGTQLPVGNLLLTGVTGFLGVHVLQEYLSAESGTVYCLLRKGNFRSEESRLKAMLFYYFENTYEELFGSRIIVVPGDITDKQVYTSGLLQKAKINTVINCAALVKHFSNTTDIEDVNYGGVLNLIDYCKTSGAKLIQVSTSSVCGYSIDNVPAADTKMSEEMLWYGQSIDNKYVRSKFLAERAILEAISKGELRAKIMRVGNLSARQRDGEFQMNFSTNSFMGRIKSMEVIGKFPYSLMNKPSELTPIDSTAKAVLLLSKTPEQCVVFHPYNNHFVFMGDIINALRKTGASIDYVEEEDFQKAADAAAKNPEKARILSSMIAYQNMGHGKKILLLGNTNDYTAQVLYRMGFQWPIPSDEYMSRFISALTGLGFFELH